VKEFVTARSVSFNVKDVLKITKKNQLYKQKGIGSSMQAGE
jgi:hypothetical protein